MRLRPAGLAVVSDLNPEQVADSTVAITPQVDRRLHALLAEIGAAEETEQRIQLAVEGIAESLQRRSIPSTGRLANEAFDVLRNRIRSRVGSDLASLLGTSERHIQRALKETLGHGPKWITRRIRLQEVARLLATQPDLDLAQLAIELGYTDQAHLTNDFRAVAGITPAAYRRSLANPSPSGAS